MQARQSHSVEVIVEVDLNTDGGLVRRGRSELFKCLAKIYCKASEKFNIMWASLSQQFLCGFFRSLLFEWVGSCRRLFDLILDPGLLGLERTSVLTSLSQILIEKQVSDVGAILVLSAKGGFIVGSRPAHITAANDRLSRRWNCIRILEIFFIWSELMNLTV